MKKISILALVFVLTAAYLTGCGCSANVGGNVSGTTAGTQATTQPPTKATTAPSTAATTQPTVPSTHATEGLIPDMTDGMHTTDATNGMHGTEGTSPYGDHANGEQSRSRGMR